MDKLRKAKKLAILQTEPNLVFFDEIQSLKNKLKAIIGSLGDFNAKEVKIYDNELKSLLEAISDLQTPINKGGNELKNAISNVVLSVEKVESAIKAIKEVKIPDFPKIPDQVSLTDIQINEILLAIQSIPEFPVSELKIMVYGLEKAIRESKNEKEDKEFDYEFLRTKFDSLVKAIKGISISVSGGGFPERSQNNLINIEANQTNRTQETKLFDSWGDDIGSTMIDQLMVAEAHRLSGGVFNGSTPDTNFYVASITANATATISGGTLDLATTTNSGSSIKAHTQSLARYVGGTMNVFRTIARFGDTGKANNTRQFGLTNKNGRGVISNFTDGFFFQLSGTTFSVVARTASSDTIINSGSFNGDVSSWTVDTNYHTFEILYTNKTIEFYIDRVRIHTFTQTNARICDTRHFKPFGANFNTGVGSVCHLYADVITISQYGTPSSQAKSDLQVGTTAGKQLKVGPGSLHRVVISGVTNNSVIDIYDGTSTSGYKIWTSGAMTNQTVPFNIDLDSSGGTQFEDGLFIVISAANSNLFTKYE